VRAVCGIWRFLSSLSLIFTLSVSALLYNALPSAHTFSQFDTLSILITLYYSLSTPRSIIILLLSPFILSPTSPHISRSLPLSPSSLSPLHSPSGLRLRQHLEGQSSDSLAARISANPLERHKLASTTSVTATSSASSSASASLPAASHTASHTTSLSHANEPSVSPSVSLPIATVSVNKNITNNISSHTVSHHAQSFVPHTAAHTASHTASHTATISPPSHTLSASHSYIQPERTHQSSRTVNTYPTSSSSLPSSFSSSGFTIFEGKKSPKKEIKKENNTAVLSEKKDSKVASSFSIFQDEEKKDEGRFLLSHRAQDGCVGYDMEREGDRSREKSATSKHEYENENKNRTDQNNKSENRDGNESEEEEEEYDEKKNDKKQEKVAEEGDNDNNTLDDILAQMGILDSEDGTINTRLARLEKYLIFYLFFMCLHFLRSVIIDKFAMGYNI
jgi:hypothetical protein